MNRYAAIILAAGSGSRLNLGYNKIFYELNDIPIVVLAAHHFFHDTNCKQLIFVGRDDELATLKKIIQTYNLHDKRCVYVGGGSERQYSVNHGLHHVQEEVVLIHDGARPFLTPSLISSLYEEAKVTGAAVPGYPVKDTIKVVKDFEIKYTIDRSKLYQVQTPQAIRTKLIKKAHEYATKDELLFTDDVSLIEHYQLSPVKIVESSPENIKITTPFDLKIAHILYSNYF